MILDAIMRMKAEERSKMIKFTIDIAPATKKNSQRIFTKKTKTGKTIPFIVPSERFKNYQRECTFYMPNIKTINVPINIKALYYMPTKRRVDITNLNGSLHDILVHYQVIKDDDSQIVVSTDGTRVLYDKECPRTEVHITASNFYNQECYSQEIMREGLNAIIPEKKKKKMRIVRV